MAKRTVVVIDSFSQVQAYKRARERDAAVATAKVKPRIQMTIAAN